MGSSLPNETTEQGGLLRLMLPGRTLSALVLGLTLSSGQAIALSTDQPEEPAEETEDFELDDLEEFDLDALLDMEVEITSISAAGQSLLETPGAVYVLTDEDVRRTGARSIPEALRVVPGFTTQRINSNTWGVSARGDAGAFANKLLVRVDGRSAYTPIFSGTYWDTANILMEDLERIEIIRGPGATIFGANAVNGVININSKSSADTQGLLFNAKIGTDLQYESAIRYGGQLGENLTYRIFGKFTEWDGLENSAVGQDGDDWNMISGGFRADYDAGDDGKFTFQGNYYNSEDLGAVTLGVSDSAAGSTLFTGDEEVNSWNFLTKYTKQIDEQNSIEVQAYYDNYDRQSLLTGFTVETFDIDARHTYLGEKHTIVWGIGYRNSELDAENSLTLEFNPAAENYDMISGFIQDTFSLGDSEKFTATIGSKFEYNDFTGFEIQPSGRLTYSHNDRTAIWAGVSRAVRTPSIFDTSGTIRVSNISGTPAGPYAGFQGNPNLDSETLMAYELGFRSQMTEEFRLDVAAFVHEYDDLITIATGVLPGVTTTNNGGAGTTWGVEALANWDVADNWTLIGSYSYFGEDFDVVSNEDDFPEHSFNIQSRLDFGENWELNTVGYYVDDPDATGSADDYFRLDVGVTWRPRENMEIAVWGMNLTNDDTIEGTNALDPTTYTVEPSIYASLSLKF